MKVLVLSNNYNGLIHFRNELIVSLINRGIEVVVAAPEDGSSRILADEGCETVIMSFDRKGKNPILDVFLVVKYFSLIKKKNPNIILSYTIKPNVYGGIASRISHTPQIANITGLGSAVENSSLLQRITVFLYKLGLKKAKKVFFQNESNLKFCVERRMVNKNFELIPGSGVNLQIFSFKPYPENTRIRFLYLGRVMREKGIDQFLEAAEDITKGYPCCEFVVVGRCEEEYKEKLMEMEEKGIVSYVGQQSDVRPYIENSHCTIHPSFYPEGMSNVLLESCALGRPIITTDRPGCREIIDDGINGFMIKQRDTQDLIEKIKMFLDLPYIEKVNMGLAARKKVEKEFDRQIVVDAYLKAIESF